MQCVQVLSAIDYFEVFLESLMIKCQKCVKLFKDNKERMFDESTSCRRSLIRYSLIFSHMVAELKAMFPHGSFSGDSYRITKRDASEWWKRTFPEKYYFTRSLLLHLIVTIYAICSYCHCYQKYRL